MLISLYTVRIKLDILGITDYGIYNIVGGVVVLFTFINSAMTQATQRFLNFAIGQNDKEQVRNVFSTSFIIHILIASIIVILAETVGLWFFYNVLNIPLDRQNAAFWVYQFSILVTVINILHVPYRAIIIAHEKMSFYALLSIIEALLRLGIVFLLVLILFDKLIVYAFLVSIVSLIVLFIHKIYCNKMFEAAHFRLCKDKDLFKNLASFSGWSIFGSFSEMTRNNGTNILLNTFYGVALNAAMGIAAQVNSAINSFVNNFQTAFRPQIIKLYAAKEYESFMKLVFRSSKASFLLIFFFVLPFILNADFILHLWLGNVPEYAVVFTQLILLNSLELSLIEPLVMSIQATGKIKKYQIIYSCFNLANLPISFLFLWLGFSPVYVLITRIGLNFIAIIWRIFFLRKRIDLKILHFLREVIVPVFLIVLISGTITYFIQGFFIDWHKLLISCAVSTVSIISLVYLIGLNKQEKLLLRNWIGVNYFRKNMNKRHTRKNKDI